MNITFSKETTNKSNVVAFCIAKDLKLTENLKKLNNNAVIEKAIEANPAFEGQDRQVLPLYACTGIGALLLLGLGELPKLNILLLQKIGGRLADELNAMKVAKAELVIEDFTGTEHDAVQMAVHIALGVKLRNYNFNKYFVDKKEKNTLTLESLTIRLQDAAEAERRFTSLEAVAEGVLRTRNLVSEPANILYPKSFMQECKQLKKLGIKIKVLDTKDMAKLGMGALLGVAQGSAKEPYTVIMEWNGGNKKDKPIAVIGKGVCFDTGGINLKTTASSIADMKYDMAGAGSVYGLMYALAKRKAAVNVVGVIGLVENMPSGTAQRPSDVVISMSGQTVEVENTDAEGRLVLADIMWYAQEEYDPPILVDMATLTGAVVMALGEGYAGLLTNDDQLATQLYEAGEKTGEFVWRLPMGEYYDRQINSEIADVRNTSTGRGGGAITAAQFLQRFVQKGRKWAHLDIAGMAWAKSSTGTSPKGATGFGVRLLDQWIAENFE